MMGLRGEVELRYYRETKTILLGHTFAHFSAPDSEGWLRNGDLTASGNLIRVHIDGKDGYVDIDISEAVTQAFKLLTE